MTEDAEIDAIKLRVAHKALLDCVLERDALLSETAGLRSLVGELAGYAAHGFTCNMAGLPCSCGLAELLARAEKARKPE